MSELPAPTEKQLYERIAAILEEARTRVARTVNTAMVQAYWLIGREIVLVEQEGAERARYGELLIEKLAPRLQKRFGKGFGVATPRRTRSFFQTYPSGSAIPAELGRVEIRSTALIESAAEIRSTPPTESETVRFPPLLGWSVRELERQIGALLFERLAASRDAEGIRALARRGQDVGVAGDVIKDPFVLEFLDLREIPAARERDLSGSRPRKRTMADRSALGRATASPATKRVGGMDATQHGEPPTMGEA